MKSSRFSLDFECGLTTKLRYFRTRSVCTRRKLPVYLEEQQATQPCFTTRYKDANRRGPICVSDRLLGALTTVVPEAPNLSPNCAHDRLSSQPKLSYPSPAAGLRFECSPSPLFYIAISFRGPVPSIRSDQNSMFCPRSHRMLRLLLHRQSTLLCLYTPPILEDFL